MAMRGTHGTAITPRRCRWVGTIEIDGVPRQPEPAGSHGTTPSDGKHVNRRHRGAAGSNKKLTRTKTCENEAADGARFIRLQNEMRAGKTGDDTARSISPISTNGKSAAAANPIIGDVAGAQIDLRRMPRLEQDDISISASCAKLQSTAGNMPALLVEIVLCPQVPQRLPCTMICAAAVRFPVQQHRIVHARDHPRPRATDRLGAADLPPHRKLRHCSKFWVKGANSSAPSPAAAPAPDQCRRTGVGAEWHCITDGGRRGRKKETDASALHALTEGSC